jgi:hypothetical protein
MTNYPAPPDKVERSMKQALVKAGFIEATDNKRGRPSEQYVTWTKGLVAAGWVIKGYVSSTGPAEIEQVTRTATTGIVNVGDPVRDEREWRAIAYKNGKAVPVGMRTVCLNSKCSLTYCPCGSCRVNLDFDLTALVHFQEREEVKT